MKMEIEREKERKRNTLKYVVFAFPITMCLTIGKVELHNCIKLLSKMFK